MADTAKTRTRRTRTQKQPEVQRQFSAEDVATIAAAAAGAAVTAALHPSSSGMVTTLPSGSNMSGAQSQGSTGSSAPSGTAQTASKPAKQARRTTDGVIGRPVNPESGLGRARAKLAEMGADAPRAEVVSSFINDLGLKKNVANTYYHLIVGKKSDAKRGRSAGKKTAQQSAAA